MRRIKGFTLLEVLIALAIVSLVFFSSFFAITQMIKNSQILRDKTIASLVATNVLTQVRLGMLVFPPKTEKMGDKVTMAKVTWNWELERVSSFQKDIQKIHIIVREPNGKVIYQASGYMHAKNS